MILLIEDNPMDVFLVKEAIADRGLQVELEVMTDGAEATAFIARIDADPNVPRPDLFLLDLNLPRTTGLEVLGRVRRSQRCASVPVLIMTSSSAERDRATTAALGATAYFCKPSGYEAFLRIGDLIQTLLK